MNYFSIKRPIFIVPSTKCCEEYEKIDEFIKILNKSEIGKLIEQEQKKYKKTNAGSPECDPYDLMATIIYCFSKFKGTVREIEDLCKFDLRVMYIMEQNNPNHAIVGKFVNKYILPYQYEIFTMITKAIIDELNADVTTQFNDGTKIEANANKYKFVWKPTTYHKNLNIKIKELLLKMNLEFKGKKWIKSFQFNELIKEYIVRENIDIDSIPNGRGKRLTKEQKNYKLAYQYLIKLLEYEEKERICGKNRNSYYKTDKDATAMVLKKRLLFKNKS